MASTSDNHACLRGEGFQRDGIDRLTTVPGLMAWKSDMRAAKVLWASNYVDDHNEAIPSTAIMDLT